MATSGTYTFNLDLAEIVEEAFERAGLELRNGYDMHTARRSLNIMSLEWANRGINLWTVESGTIACVAGTTTYDLPANTIDLLEQVVRLNAGSVPSQTDYELERISVVSYAQIPNKLSQGRPVQAYIDRQIQPTITLWPTPDQAYSLIFWYLRRIEDTGQSAALNMDIPPRFIPALVSGLAYFIAMKKPEAAERAPLLKQVYEEQFSLAAAEDREKASMRFVPYGSGYR